MKFCPQCGSELKEGAKFCASCGFQVASASQAPPPPPPPPPPPTPAPAPEPVFQPREAAQAFSDAFTGNTNIFQRIINILTKPKQEWPVIDREQPNTMKLLVGYALILVLIPAIATFIAYGVIGVSFMGYTYRNVTGGIMQALIQIFSGLAGVYILAWVIDLLAPSFDSEKNLGKSLQVAVYSYTASWVAGIFLLVPGLKWLTFILGLYSIFLMAYGMPVMKKTPQPKVIGYVAITIIVMLVLGFLLALIFGALFGLFFYGSMRGFGM